MLTTRNKISHITTLSNKKSHSVIKIIDRIKDFYDFTKDKQVADKLEIKQNTLATWKMRDSGNIETIITKCDDVNLHWLITGEGSPESPPTIDQAYDLAVDDWERDLINRVHDYVENKEYDASGKTDLDSLLLTLRDQLQVQAQQTNSMLGLLNRILDDLSDDAS